MRIISYRPQTYLGGGEQKNSTAQQYTNATQKDLRSKCAATLSEHIKKKASRSIEQILLVENSDSGLANSMDIKKAFAKLFPNKKLIYAFRNSVGKIHLEFDSADTAADIMQNWNKDAMGTDTGVTNHRGKRRQNALTIRGVDTGISEETQAEQMRRFIKKPDNAKITTVKVDLQERTMLETALANGLFVDQLFFRPTEYIEKTDIHVTRCFNCQKFGHIAPSCNLGQKCGKCAENHNTDSCHQPEQNYECVNCLEQHSSASKESLSTWRLWRSCIRADRYPYQNNYKTILTDSSPKTIGPHNAIKYGRVKHS